ncbi:spore protease YyaC [Halobacillus sp. MO56]
MNLRERFLHKETRHLYSDPLVVPEMSERLLDLLPQERKIVVVCIGTDRSTGDSFGPLAGSMITDQNPKHFSVYGTLANPVHALNLKDTIQEIHSSYTRPFIIAIDACLGKNSSIGIITVSKGALAPGAAMKKDLPKVGDISISGIVNVGGFMEYFVLQNTRLHTVIEMASQVSQAFHRVDLELQLRDRKKPAFRNISTN